MKDEGGRAAVIDYIQQQPEAVRVWMSAEARRILEEYKPRVASDRD